MILRGSEPTWAEAKRQLGESTFIKQLMNFDKDNISDRVLKKIGSYCSQSDFQPDIIGRVSGAAKSLCMWVRAMEVYGRVYRVVEPKKQRLNAAMSQLKEKQDALADAKAKLAEVEAKMAELKQQYDEKLAQKEELKRKAEYTELMLERATKLMSGLAGEKERWQETVKDLEERMGYLSGDCLMAAASCPTWGPSCQITETNWSRRNGLRRFVSWEFPVHQTSISVSSWPSRPRSGTGTSRGCLAMPSPRRMESS